MIQNILRKVCVVLVVVGRLVVGVIEVILLLFLNLHLFENIFVFS